MSNTLLIKILSLIKRRYNADIVLNFCDGEIKPVITFNDLGAADVFDIMNRRLTPDIADDKEIKDIVDMVSRQRSPGSMSFTINNQTVIKKGIVLKNDSVYHYLSQRQI